MCKAILCLYCKVFGDIYQTKQGEPSQHILGKITSWMYSLIEAMKQAEVDPKHTVHNSWVERTCYLFK